MKYLIILSLTLTTTCFGQELTTNEKKKLSKKETIEHQQAKIDALVGEMEQLKDLTNESAQIMLKLQKENEKLRDILRDYILQIDDLNIKNIQLNTELDKCKDGK